MIARIGVICQDRISYGFLVGLRDRLECRAELVEPPAALGKQRNLTKRAATQAAADLRKRGVDLIVRFTDADQDRWQQVCADETQVFPPEVRSILVCGVATPRPERWLSLCPEYLAPILGLREQQLKNAASQEGLVKHALAKAAGDGAAVSNLVARIVGQAPSKVFRAWLRADDALRTLYEECRAAAARAGCETPNEL